LPTQMPPRQTANLFCRVIDAAGLPVSNRQALNYSGTAVAGGGTISSSVIFSTFYPNLIVLVAKMGPDPGRNTFRISFANLPPLVFDVEGVRP